MKILLLLNLFILSTTALGKTSQEYLIKKVTSDLSSFHPNTCSQNDECKMKESFLPLLESMLTSYDPKDPDLDGPYAQVYVKAKALSPEKKALLKAVITGTKKLSFKISINDVEVEDLCSLFDDQKVDVYEHGLNAMIDALVRLDLDDLIDDPKNLKLVFWSGYEDQKNFMDTISQAGLPQKAKDNKVGGKDTLKIKVSIP